MILNILGAKIRTLSIFLYTSNSERITSSAEAIPLSVVTCPAIGTTVTRHPAAAGLAMRSEKLTFFHNRQSSAF